MPLIDYIRDHSTRLLPQDTGRPAELPSFTGIRAAAFDIYGTMLVSAAGDISLAGRGSSPEHAVTRALEKAGAVPAADPKAALRAYRQAVKRHQESRRAEGIEFPEVEIREVWRELIEEFGGLPERASMAAVVYECDSNPVWPMPDLGNCLKALRRRGLRLGIVSNAQFYTRELFPALAKGTLEELGFDPGLMIFSYELRESKPSRRLYSELASRLFSVGGIRPEETLYIGNDLRKDIWPARKEGFKTVLFAGDRRSLRLHQSDPAMSRVEPDAIVTGLAQVPDLLAQKGPREVSIPTD